MMKYLKTYEKFETDYNFEIGDEVIIDKKKLQELVNKG